MAKKNVILKNIIGDVLHPEIADNSVTTDKIIDGAVTKEKLSNDVLEDITTITWHELKQLRDGNNLLPGHQYRITDYQCTTTQENTQSAGHQFDIIVTADSTNKLNEKARACLHDGDTYFQNSNLAAWQLWYCLDNDTNRFVWADNSLGHGVIYRMIDEWNNDCPYDFKNILFRRYKITSSNPSSLVGTYLATEANSYMGIEIDGNDSKMFYTFSYLGDLSSDGRYSLEIPKDASIIGNTLESDDSSPYGVHGNTIKYYFDVGIENSKPIQSLNNIVFLTYSNGNGYYGCYSNSFDINNYNNSFGNNCINNSFRADNEFIIFGNDCICNSFYSCNTAILGQQCVGNLFDFGCGLNVFGDNCNYNYFGCGSSQNSFGNDCNDNYFNRGCHLISFGNSCSENSFGNSSSQIKLGNYYRLNTFDSGVENIIFNGDGDSSNGNYIKYYHIKQSMVFDELSKYTITAKPGLNYELSVAKRSDGIVVEYNEADTSILQVDINGQMQGGSINADDLDEEIFLKACNWIKQGNKAVFRITITSSDSRTFMSSASSDSRTIIATTPIYLLEINTDGVITKTLDSYINRATSIRISSDEIADSKVPVHIE